MPEMTDKKTETASLPPCSKPDYRGDTDIVIQLFQDSEFLSICEQFESKHSDTREAQLGFNAFKLVSDTFYRENFHSDVLAAFFDMRGAHGEKSLFLHQFIELIKSCSSPRLAAAINTGDFLNYETPRESGRIDIRVQDLKSRKAIIVENKINNAGDQPHQLYRYLQDTKSLKFDVVAIIYLSLDGRKDPSMQDWGDEEKRAIEPILIPLAAVKDGKDPNLLKNWVYPCLQLTSSADALIILRQYGRLLQYLGANEMDYAIMKQFHDWLLKDTNYKRALTMRQMLGEIPSCICKMIMDKYRKPACAPFDYVYAWKPTYPVFADFRYGKGLLYIDFDCSEKQFSVQLYDRNRDNGVDVVKQALTESRLLDEFRFNGSAGNGRFVKVFEFPSQEDALFSFIDKVLLGFRKLKDGGKVPGDK